MTEPAGCIATVMSAAKDMSATEALDLLEYMRGAKDRLIADGRTGDLNDALKQAGRDKAKQEQIAKALARKHAVLTALARGNVYARLDNWRAQGLSAPKALLSLFEGTVRNIGQGRFSINAMRLGLEGRYVGSLLSEIEKADPSIIGELIPAMTDTAIMAGRAVGLMDRTTPLSTKPFLDDVVREMAGMKSGVVQKVTKNERAQTVAAIFYKYAELSRRDLNRMGANIGALDGWAGPQMHDSDRMMRVSESDWVDSIIDRLDWEKTFVPLGVNIDPRNRPEIRRVLGEVYKTLTTGRDMEITPAEKGLTTGPANLARQLAKHRVLHFRTADDWLDYNDLFGHGHVFNAIIGHQQRSAQVGAVMSMLGPNPRALIQGVMDKLQKDVRNDRKLTGRQRRRQIEALKLEGTSIGAALEQAVGQTAASSTWSRIGRGARATQSLSKLGAAVWSSIGDVVTAATNQRYHGKPLGIAYVEQITQAVKGRGSRGEERARTFLLGEGFDGLIDQIATPWVAEDGAAGAMHKAMTTFFKWSGLTRWTDSNRGAAVRIMAADMGRLASRAWDSLDPRYKRVLRQHGIDSARWELIRSTAYVAGNGKRYVTPDMIANLPDDVLAPLVTDRLELLQAGLGERERARAAQDQRESDWLAGRTSKYFDRFDRARTKLDERKATLDAKGQERIAGLSERLQSLHDDIADLQEIYLGSRPAGADVRHRIADDAAQGGANMLGELEAAMPGFKEHATLIRDAAYEVRKLWARDKPPSIKTVATKLSLAMDSIKNARPMAAEIPGMQERLDTLYEAMETAALHLEPGPAPRAVGRSEGRAQVTATNLRKNIAQLGRDLERARGTLDDDFIETWTERQAELTAFGERIEKSQAERTARGAADSAGQAERIAAVYEEARFNLEMDLRRFYSDEVNFAVVETDPVARRLTALNSQAGTLGGEIIRTIMQFKGYPIAFTQRVLGRAVYGFEGSTGQRIMTQGMHIGTLVAGLTVAGYASQTAKDMLRGYGPRDPSNPATWGAAFLQGGGAGIFGDFLFGEYNRFGGGTIETAVGPTAGTLGDALDLWAAFRAGEARGKTGFDLILQNTPFANLWFARPAMDYFVLNDLREALSPGFVERQRQTRYEKYGQEAIY